MIAPATEGGSAERRDGEQMNAADAHPAGRHHGADLLAMVRAGPAGFLARAAAVAAAALVVSRLHAAHDPGVLCPLRRLTGIPCPLCGSTTVFIELGAGNVARAVLANPVTFAGMAGLVVAPLGPGRWWWRSSARLRHAVLAAALSAAWLYQLVRFDLLPP
jgi:hypothetical protein